MIEVEGLTVRFGGVTPIDGTTVTFPEGTCGLIGPNGAGKTTFFNMLTGVYKPTSGKIVFDGTDVTGKPPHAITQLGVGRTFQNIRLFQQMTALENVLVGMHSRLASGFIRTILRTPKIRRQEREAIERARELLRFCSLRGRDDEWARNLSYGDQRRLEIARAMALRPKVLLLDEPTAGMNPQESAAFNEFVYRVRDEKGISVLLIEHDMHFLMQLAERVVVLNFGRKIADGAPDIIRSDPAVMDAYLGAAVGQAGAPSSPPGGTHAAA